MSIPTAAGGCSGVGSERAGETAESGQEAPDVSRAELGLALIIFQPIVVEFIQPRWG